MTDDKDKPVENASDVNAATETKSDPWTQSAIAQEVATDGKAPADKSSDDSANIKWQQDLINRLAFSSINEQRRARRWGIFFKSLTFVYLFAILFMFMRSAESPDINLGAHTALVEIHGPIMDSSPANAEDIISALRDAFEDKNAHGIILRINSPGGSPVQAGYINDEIKRLKTLHPEKKVYAVVTDLAASAAYYIAVSADEIYADKASMVGSIGVLMDGYGFVDAMNKLGVERRLMTAGENKAFLDPFSPLKSEHKEHVQHMLNTVHKQFIGVVKEGRGDRLKDKPELFSGLVWAGEEAVALGLVDGLGSSGYVARELIGAERIVDYTYHPDFMEQFAEQMGASMATAMQAMFSSASMR